MPFPLFLAIKYLKPKRTVASVITCVSVLGVLLGVAAVIVVRTVMTGFGQIWQDKILDFKPHVTLQSRTPGALVTESILPPGSLERIAAVDGVESVSPEIDTIALLKAHGRVTAPMLIGVESDVLEKAYRVGKPLAGTFDLESDDDAIILGVDLADSLGVWIGDEVKVFSPMISDDQFFLPVKWRVTGVFSSGQRDYDAHFAVARLDRVQDIMGIEDGVYSVNIRTRAPADASKFAAAVKAIAREAPRLRIRTWQEDNRDIFTALAVEQNMTTLLLALITVVAVFCVMNTLLVLGVQKTAEIGLLKALGFSNWRIMGVFILHGMFQCAAGCALGIGAAMLVLANLQNLVDMLGAMGIPVFPKEVYGLDAIPHELVPSAVILPVAMAFASAFAASLLPALAAALKKPVDALRK